MSHETPTIPGADAVVAWFGQWPSFHDAEIVELHLNRAGHSWVKLHAWLTTQTGEPGEQKISTDRHAVVTFTLREVADLELTDFSAQNVIFGLELEHRSEGHRLILKPCFGLSGFIQARAIEVEVVPSRTDGILSESRNA